jgi:protein associated with RNAse G/E
LYAETEETIILFSSPGISYWDYRKNAWLKAQDGLLEIYFTKKWYNVWHIAEQVSNTNLIYINISMPAALQAGILTWVDLDLDYRVHMDNSVERLDELDFIENSQKMGYPPEVVKCVRAACREVEADWSKGISVRLRKPGSAVSTD